MENIEWVGQFNAYDDEKHPQIIRIGIQQEGEHTVGIYFDHDIVNADAFVCERSTALDYIQRQWGTCKTFRWLVPCHLPYVNITGVSL